MKMKTQTIRRGGSDVGWLKEKRQSKRGWKKERKKERKKKTNGRTDRQVQFN
jgi:hypothetical protein